jgi:hypothetical protein
MATRGDAAGNAVDLTRGHKNGLFQPAADNQSEKQNDGQKHALAANKTSADMKPNPTARTMASQSWWESPEAHALFCDKKRSKGDNGDSLFPQEPHVEGRTERLKNGFTSANGWKTVFDDFDATDIWAPNDIFNIQMKCKHVSLALHVAMGDMLPAKKWMDCCDHAVKELERVDRFTHIGHARTVQRWHLSCRQNNESF